MAHDNRYPPYRSSGYDDRMYDDRYSRSRSVERGQYPLHDHTRDAPRGPAGHRRPEYPEDRDRDYRGSRDDFRRSSPHRSGGGGRQAGYRDRDREGYRSPEYDDTRSRSPSRSRSRGRNRDRDRERHRGHVQESREVIMEGLPVDMVEEDVRQLHPVWL
ncbi:hypothetical protein TMatcc_009554 [Talaromyces marneffei ATCC 18224]|nr:hypothetical protein EYB25_009534 [Talaromyces marneffei]